MQFMPKEEGQGIVEYALILVLVAVVGIVIIALLGQAIGNVYSNIVNAHVPTPTATPLPARVDIVYFQGTVLTDKASTGKYKPLTIPDDSVIVFDLPDGQCYVNFAAQPVVIHLPQKGDCVRNAVSNQ